ncbi:hypothetical protein AB3X94_37165 [Paraburkholderia sp. BR10923]|uniref:hypothetical protein n=1 Tax=Paraburkholderia sp. BR10923 TaxID=3236992 RepID=UPI0034CE4EE7
MSDVMTDLPSLVAEFELDRQRVNVWVNGDEDTDYTTADNVLVPSIRKVVANVELMIAPDVAAITAGATTATNAASAANASAAAALQSENNAAASAQTSTNNAQATQTDAANALDSMQRAEAAATSAGSARDTVLIAQGNVQQNATAAAQSATQAAGSATAAADSATASGEHAAAALASQQAAAQSAGQASSAEAAASQSEANAAQSAADAAQSEANAAQSATDAEASAQRVENIGGLLEIDLSGGDRVLTPTETLSVIFRLVGELDADRSVTFDGPANFVVQNLTTGDFSVTLRVAGADTATVVVQQGIAQNFFSDASGVYATSATTESTQPNSLWYTLGASDVVGSFADGDLSIRTPGFTAPFVRVVRNGLSATRGKHYTLNGDSIHIDFADPLNANDEIEVQTQGVTTGSSFTVPSIVWVQPAAGASFVSFPHTVGFAWLMLRGVFLVAGTDYTDDPTGFFLVGFTADGSEKFGVLALAPITIADCLKRSANLSDVQDRIAACKTLGVGRILLDARNATGNTVIAFTNLTDFDVYELVMEGALPALDNQNFAFQFSNDNGATWIGTPNYRIALTFVSSTPSSPVTSGPENELTTINPWSGASNNAGSPIYASYEATYIFSSFSDPARFPSMRWQMAGTVPGPTISRGQTVGVGELVAFSGLPINAFRIYVGAGGFQRGKFMLYGLPSSLPN